MAVLLAPTTLFILIVVLCSLLGLLWLHISSINKRLQQSIKLINELYLLNKSQANTLEEQTNLIQSQRTSSEQAQIHDSALQDISQQQETLAGRVLALENETQLLAQQDPELKMYSRAQQLVKDGASIKDIMEATQLPRAELEVLVGLQRPQTP